MCAVCVLMDEQKPEGMSDIHSIILHFISSKQSLSLNLWLDWWPASRCWCLLPLSASHSTDVKGNHTTTSAFLMGIRDSNSDPHILMASKLIHRTLSYRFEFCLYHRVVSFSLPQALCIPPGYCQYLDERMVTEHFVFQCCLCQASPDSLP